MASIEVIRGLAHRRYSCLQLYHQWFECGIITENPRDLDGCHYFEEELESSYGSSIDLGPIHEVTGCSLEPVGGIAASFKMKHGGRKGGGLLAATMASKAHSPTSLTPSGSFAGVGRGDGQNYPHPTLYPSDISYGTTNEDECLEKFCSLKIAEDNIEEAVESYNDDVKDVLRVLKQFGVTSHPVPYRPQEQRRESQEIFCKNLFLKDKRGQFFLVICDENQSMDLKWLRRKLKAYRNFSFATGYEMHAILRVEPGGVTPFALMHGSARDVRVVMTTDLTTDRDTLLNFHPLDQNLTLPIKINHLENFLQHYRVHLEYLDMDN